MPGIGRGGGISPRCKAVFSVVSAQLAAQGLHAAFDQSRGGGGTSTEMLCDVGQCPALQVAQPDCLTLVVGQYPQGLHQQFLLLSPDGFLTGSRMAGIQFPFQRPHTLVGVVQRSVPLHVAFLKQSVVANRARDFVIQDALEPGGQLPSILAGELLETAMCFQKRLLDDIGGIQADGDSPMELSFGQAMQGRSLRLQQLAQCFSIAQPGLFEQCIREMGFRH